jgi:excisionase family DNA binding protein
MTPAEVARLFHVDPKTVSRWANAGKLRSFKTPGGHRRFYEADIRALLTGGAK